jgi:ABC-type nitrate/sulfonate/bicarbonate transport system ATPase subunit
MKGAVEISHLQKAFKGPDGRQIPVLNDINISIPGGQFVCLVGPSGCGKTTILHAIAGILQKDAGTILIDGRDHRAARFGYVFQESRLLNWRTVSENVRFGAVAAGIDGKEISSLVNKYTELVGLGDFKDAYPLSLSGGMQQRVAIARAFVVKPDVLLMDEPFSSLDELTAHTMRSELLQFWERERHTVIFITHNTSEAVYLADKIYTLGKRGSGITAEFDVEIARPRDIEDPKLIELRKRVLATLHH